MKAPSYWQFATGILPLGIGIMLLAYGCASKPSQCRATGSGSFADFYQNQWSHYCDWYTNQLLGEAREDLKTLTLVLAAHPARVDQLNKQLATYDQPSRCFSTPAEKVNYRSLTACLDSEQSGKEGLLLWGDQADAWLEELDRLMKRLRPRLDKTRRAIGGLLQGEDGLLVRKDDTDGRVLRGIQDDLREHLKDLMTIEQQLAYFDEVQSISRAHPDIQNLIDNQYAPKVLLQRKQLRELTALFTELKTQERFLDLRALAHGRSCPEASYRDRRIQRALERALKDKTRSWAPLSSLRLSAAPQKKTPPESTDLTGEGDPSNQIVEIEEINAHLCAPRGSQNQFSGRQQLCAVWKVSASRSRSAGSRRFGEWHLTLLEEGDPDEGVDCSKIKK